MAWRTEPSSSSFAAQTQSAPRQAGGPGADDFGHELAPEAVRVRVPDATSDARDASPGPRKWPRKWGPTL